MLEQFGWPSLQKRREVSRLTMLYKMHNSLVDLNMENYVQPITRPTRTAHPSMDIWSHSPGQSNTNSPSFLAQYGSGIAFPKNSYWYLLWRSSVATWRKMLSRSATGFYLHYVYAPSIQALAHSGALVKWPRCIKFAFERKSEKSNANWFLTNQNRALRTCVWFFWLAFKRKFYATDVNLQESSGLKEAE